MTAQNENDEISIGLAEIDVSFPHLEVPMNYNTVATMAALGVACLIRMASPSAASSIETRYDVGAPRTLCAAIYTTAVNEIATARSVEELNALKQSAAVLANDSDPDCRAAAELTARVANSVQVEPDLALLDY